ncbi:TetR/AcrR family transcriptional regulator [Mycobacterium deserti]|uniref:TetR/AcrR family transcriptional regulator n=1 Tax=Mycobacterium deserti TaxID=2978347 RepID=A0ABT2M818_9MYCO|nr:TetR/AcrR family transcriptional regulator [Mycobacterium deserti]MCT7657151.1 TetR/AcrR family transcriptional regulator [Mycobacterium deserti]
MSEDGHEGARKSDRTRLTILDAARIAFARKGFSGVTIRDITDLARVTRASFYYYFRDKTELFIELGTATYREAMGVVETLGAQGEPPTQQAIEEWVGRYFEYLDRNGAFVARSEEDMPQDAAFRAAVARSHRRAATVLGRRIAKIAATPPRADATSTGLAVMALLERSWLLARHNNVSTMPRDEARAAASELVWRTVDYTLPN